MPSYEHPRPSVAADIVAISSLSRDPQLLLVRRGGEPFRGCWALPGGFVEQDEALPRAATRELAEETGIVVAPAQLQQLGAYGDPGRDPRGWTVSIVFIAVLDQQGALRAGDDASEVAWRPFAHLPPLAFDHAQVLADAARWLVESGQISEEFLRSLG